MRLISLLNNDAADPEPEDIWIEVSIPIHTDVTYFGVKPTNQAS